MSAALALQVRTRPWPQWPDPREEDVEAAAAVVRSGAWWQYAGEQTTTFEREFAAYQDAAQAHGAVWQGRKVGSISDHADIADIADAVEKVASARDL